jgi:hypothetical protein
MKSKSISLLSCIILCITFIASCSKETAAPADPCIGKSIVINGSVTPTSGGSSSTGSIAITASGSTGFTFSLNNGAFQANANFTNLAAGTYSITAKDADGCSATKSFTVTASPCPTITITAISINASSLTATDGSLTATATGSTGITYSINNGPFQSTGVFNSLAVGSYTISVKDVNACTASASFVVASASCPAISVAATATQTSGPSATNGTITATASGGTAPYTYSKDGTTFQATGLFNNLLAGNYSIIAKDANGCIGTSSTIVVTSAACPAISITTSVTGSDKCANNTGAITITATGSTGFTYNLNNSAYQSSNVFGALGIGNYTVGVKDANGCVNTGTAAISVGPAGALFANVKAIVSANCALSGCHAGASPQNGINFADDCTIVAQSARIKARAVDNVPSVMPPTGALSTSDKQKIIDWVNGGGQYNN